MLKFGREGKNEKEDVRENIRLQQGQRLALLRAVTEMWAVRAGSTRTKGPVRDTLAAQCINLESSWRLGEAFPREVAVAQSPPYPVAQSGNMIQPLGPCSCFPHRKGGQIRPADQDLPVSGEARPRVPSAGSDPGDLTPSSAYTPTAPFGTGSRWVPELEERHLGLVCQLPYYKDDPKVRPALHSTWGITRLVAKELLRSLSC